MVFEIKKLKQNKTKIEIQNKNEIIEIKFYLTFFNLISKL